MATFNYKQEYDRYKKYYLSLEPIFNKPSNRAYTAVIFSFLAVSLFGWYAIRPTMQTIFTLKREISDRTEVNKKMEDKISALIEAQATYEAIQQDIPLFTEALPQESEPVRAVAQIQGLALESGVDITGLSVSPVLLKTEPSASKLPTTGKVKSIPMSITVNGPFTNIKNFLLGISDLRRITQIASLEFVPQNESIAQASESAIQVPTDTQVKVDVKLNVFYVTL